jgi:glycosyltransferase involved in cell wall biosynthesis
MKPIDNMELSVNYPPVSFVIPAHNEANYLPATLEAIKAACNQLQLGFEIIVVNDASSDETAKRAAEFGARVIDVNLRNIGAVRNAGAAQARFDHLIFVDADTLVPLLTLQQTLAAFASGSVGGGARVDITKDRPLPMTKYLMYLAVYIGWQMIGRWAAGCYMFCLKAPFFEFGGFDEEYYAAEEYFFSRNLKARGRFTLVHQPVITSSRKLHAYSCWQLMRFLTRPMLAGRQLFRSKVGLEILYEDPRA